MTDTNLYDIKSEQYYTCEREEMLAFVPLGAKTILDIGCGDGSFAGILKARNQAEVWGVELMQASGEKAIPKLDKVMIGEIEQYINELPDNYFNAITCNDVLEHIFEAEDLLLQLKSKLKSGGVLVSSIPNVRYLNNLIHVLFEKDFRYEDEGIRDKTHMRFYTQKSIIDMFERTGYKVVKSEGINPTKSMRYYIYKILMPFIFTADTKFVQIATVAVKV